LFDRGESDETSQDPYEDKLDIAARILFHGFTSRENFRVPYWKIQRCILS
jgi:hypothetical protein